MNNDWIEKLLPDKPSLKRDELAEAIDVPVQTLAKMAMDRTGPQYFKIVRAVRYSRSACVDWLRKNSAAIPAPL